MSAPPAERAARLVGLALDIQGAVSLDDDMLSLPAWTSLTHVRLIMEIEADLGRELSATEIASLNSVRAVAALLTA